jgi:hypothetical protein
MSSNSDYDSVNSFNIIHVINEMHHFENGHFSLYILLYYISLVYNIIHEKQPVMPFVDTLGYLWFPKKLNFINYHGN